MTAIASQGFSHFSHISYFSDVRYCQNMDDAHAGVTEIGENHPLLVNCQKELGHQLPLSSYLLKPVQRLTKYQLLLKDLQSAGIVCPIIHLITMKC